MAVARLVKGRLAMATWAGVRWEAAGAVARMAGRWAGSASVAVVVMAAVELTAARMTAA